jgi:predicted Zn finger-like uncharacterized protein
MNIECTSCQARIRVPESAAGKKGKCPKCGTTLTIPAAPDQPPAADEALAVPEVPVAEVHPFPPEPTGYASAPLPPPLPSGPPPVPKASRREQEPPRGSRYDDEDDDYDNRPSGRGDDDLNIRRRGRPPSIAMSLTSMIVGIAGLLVSLGITGVSTFFAIGCPCLFYGGYVGVGIGGLLAILALVFGFVGLYQGGRWYAITGLITGGLNIIVILLYIVATVVLGVVIFGAAANQANQPQPMFAPPPPRPIVPPPPPQPKFKKF